MILKITIDNLKLSWFNVTTNKERSTMAALQTKTIKLIKNKEVYNDLVKQHKKLTASIADLQQTLKSIDEKILSTIPDDVSEIVVDSGTIEMILAGGNVTWDQDKLIDSLKNYVKKHDENPIDLIRRTLTLKPRVKECEMVDLSIDEARKVAETYRKMVIK